jgi:hypothetical protein
LNFFWHHASQALWPAAKGAHSSRSSSSKMQQGILSILDPRLHAPLLRHPSINQEQQIIAALQQTSKELHAAVAARLAGQLPVVLCIKQLQHVQAYVRWLRKHASLLQSLHLQLPCSYDAMYVAHGGPQLQEQQQDWQKHCSMQQPLVPCSCSALSLQELPLDQDCCSSCQQPI